MSTIKEGVIMRLQCICEKMLAMKEIDGKTIKKVYG